MSKQEEVKTKEEEVKITATDTTPTKKEGEFKIKSAKKMKNLGEEKIPDIIKVDLSKPKKEEKDAVQTQKTNDSDAVVESSEDSKDSEGVVKEVRPTDEGVESDSPIQEITDENDTPDEAGVDGSVETTTTSSKQEEIPQEV